MTHYYNPADIAHLPDHYPKLRYRVLGPFASSVMLLAAKVPLYTEAELELERVLDAAAKKLGVQRE